MPSIIIQSMGGRIPRQSPRLLPNNQATVASMSRLWAGEVQPFYRLLENPNVILPTPDPVRTIYLLIDKWLAWTTDVDVVTGFNELTGPEHIYDTGDEYPKQAVYNEIYLGPSTPGTGPPELSMVHPIGIDGPTVQLTATVVGAGSGDPIARTYVFTYYTKMNEESVPSVPTDIVIVETDQSVDLTGFPTPVSPEVTEMRIYRSTGTGFFYVDSVPVSPPPAVYHDVKLDGELGEELQSLEYYPPPANLTGLIGLACGSLAGFVGNKVYFSEPYQPGAWPPEYVKIFDYEVVALGTFGQTCVVATKGYTYLVSGSAPSSFAVARVPDPYPCVSKRSMVSTSHGVIYASANGLMFVGTGSLGAGGTKMLTRDLMTYREWQEYVPNSINGVIFDGRYYGFYEVGTVDINLSPGAGFIFSILDASATGTTVLSEFDKDDVFVDLDFFASASFADPQVPLTVVVNTMIPDDFFDLTGPIPSPRFNSLMQWEGSPSPHPYVWRSKQFSFPYDVTFGAAKILFREESGIEELSFRVYDGATQQLLFERVVSSRRPFRLPSLRARTDWMFEVEGTRSVQMLHVATAYVDLAEGKAP